MRLVITLSLAALIAAAAACGSKPAPPTGPTPAAGSRVSGVVLDESTRRPVTGATAAVSGTSSAVLIAKTGASGAYLFTNVPSGAITLRVTADGYQDQGKDLTLS